ncbi:hypothetical protein [Anaeromyxobacter paludicola]|uniref:Uncharacterized protein n=1 Tax=Anaeromyxobacter paludicola TaxID=2918171 RepID=A0ABM7XB88_9BACT|nr:hypothetical protein [Anaeromyxobacter paludicola]BDG09134.1 hypothetical protein AMPC_22470 [Anaeromyxobacter paludicola]
MRSVHLVLSRAVLLLALAVPPSLSAAQSLPTPTCAWQFSWTPSGPGNWLLADTGNRWWYMPIDAQWRSVTLTGTYPRARFFSIAVYDEAPVSTGLADHLFDAQIAPDPGSVNPFDGARSHGRANHHPQQYTMTVARTEGTAPNALRLHADTGWLLYRLYLSDAGEGTTGGVPLPGIAVTDASGQTTTLPACARVNRQSELATLQPQFVPALLEDPPRTPPVPDHVWFAPISVPPARLLPNPDNKYLVSFFMSDYDPARVLVIRGKMPAFPDTFDGGPVWKPAAGFHDIQLRYWSMCLGSLVSPLPIEGCAVDATTPLDASGFYTVVISNDVLRPDWLPPQVAWIPWGDEGMVPKLIFLRNLLASPGFGHAAQDAVEKGCGLVFNFPTPLTQEEITPAGQCSLAVMGDYYPMAIWCDRRELRAGGWPACFARGKSGD